MKFSFQGRLFALFLSVVVFSGIGIMQAFGDEDEKHEGEEKGEMEGGMLMAQNATWQTECSACHIAYPPGMLPATSWREMMRTLDQHFGTDASLDAQTVAEILPFLEKNAGEGSAKTLRITETGWFKHEHDEVSEIVWKRVKSPSNCAACHTQADKGNFDEDTIRIPKQ